MLKIVAVFHLAVGLCVLAAVSCGGDSAPTAPSPVPAGGGGRPAEAAGGRIQQSPGSAPAADFQPAAAGLDHLAPPRAGGFNAYDLELSWQDGMLALVLVEDQMAGMRRASHPYRQRRIDVWYCPAEPHHVGMTCGVPIWSASRTLAGRLELPAVPLAACDEWVVVQAAELSDDRQDGWRNAPCDDAATPRFFPPEPEPEPAAESAAVQSTVDSTIAAAGGLVAGRGQLNVVDVRELFRGTEGTDGDDYRPTSSDVTVATVEMTNNPRVRVTPVGPGTATIQVVFLRSRARVEFDVRVGREATETLLVPHSAGNRVKTPFSTALGAPPVNNVPQAQTVARNYFNRDFNAAQWQTAAETAAETHCTDAAQGYERATSVSTGSDEWEYSSNQNTFPNSIQYYARKARTWSATCERTVIVYE